VLVQREGTGEVVTGTEDSPYSATTVHDPIDLILNFALLPPVSVDRATAVTPRRNAQVEAALQFAAELAAWADRVSARLRADVLTSVTVKALVFLFSCFSSYLLSG
jgi:hypothetical protein